jgi:hypothetical protein
MMFVAALAHHGVLGQRPTDTASTSFGHYRACDNFDPREQQHRRRHRRWRQHRRDLLRCWQLLRISPPAVCTGTRTRNNPSAIRGVTGAGSNTAAATGTDPNPSASSVVTGASSNTAAHTISGVNIAVRQNPLRQHRHHRQQVQRRN